MASSDATEIGLVRQCAGYIESLTHHAMASSDRIGLVQDVESLVVTVCDARILAANPSHA